MKRNKDSISKRESGGGGGGGGGRRRKEWLRCIYITNPHPQPACNPMIIPECFQQTLTTKHFHWHLLAALGDPWPWTPHHCAFPRGCDHHPAEPESSRRGQQVPSSAAAVSQWHRLVNMTVVALMPGPARYQLQQPQSHSEWRCLVDDGGDDAWTCKVPASTATVSQRVTSPSWWWWWWCLDLQGTSFNSRSLTASDVA